MITNKNLTTSIGKKNISAKRKQYQWTDDDRQQDIKNNGNRDRGDNGIY